MKAPVPQKIVPNLWFDHEAESAVKFYTSVFERSSAGKVLRYGEEGFERHRKPAHSVMLINFELEGYRFTALNGGSRFKANPSFSFFVTCETTGEVDTL